MEEEEKKLDTLFNFNYSAENNNALFEFNNHQAQKAYIITNDDFNKAQKYHKKNDTSTTDEKPDLNFHFVNSLSDLKQNVEYNIVTEDFLTTIKYDKKEYNEKHILCFGSTDKKFIFFENDLNILEIAKNKEINNKS